MEPIFIFGITPRSGTNYLHGLVTAHPACVPAGLPEDHLFRFADRLEDYVADVDEAWRRRWAPETVGYADELRRSLGGALVAFLQSVTEEGTRVVTKTPRVENLGRVLDLVPQSRVLVIVRDGRAVVESGRASFGWDVEYGTRWWAGAADTILAAEAVLGSDDRYLRIRYEDVVDDDGALGNVLDFLELDRSEYDFAAARSLPVRGSSQLKDPDGKVSWDGFDVPPDFDPRERWAAWEPAQHARFNWIAGTQLSALGYDPVAVPTSSTRQRITDALRSARRGLPAPWKKAARTLGYQRSARRIRP